MPSLAEVQVQMRNALVTGDVAPLLPLLIGGRDPRKRLAVHQRHYQASLASALATKFPATAWLVGCDFLGETARAFVRRHPPMAPCIAEFGETFSGFVASAAGAGRVPYLRDFATLEWHLGHAAVAVENPALPLQALSGYPQEVLPDLTLRLQPGVHYLLAGWPVDDLIRLYLEDRTPDRYGVEPAEIRIEIRGARGAFNMTRLDSGTFAFRRALHEGRPIGVAAETAIDADAAFDPGQALAAVMNEGLAVAIESEAPGEWR